MKFNPEKWLETTVRGIKEYTESALDLVILDEAQNPVGLQQYEVVMEFPGADLDTRKVPNPKTIIHFEIDDLVDSIIGIGENYFRDNYDEVEKTLKPQEAIEHRVNFDVGIWAWDKSGGTTSRMRAVQVLTNLFGGTSSIDKLRAATDEGDGVIEIIGYQGGRFITDRVNDVPVYRMVGGELEVRVFSRTPMPTDAEAVPAIEEIVQSPGLTILG